MPSRESEVSLPEIVLIAAVAESNRVIGNGLDLPWHIPEDLRHFKEMTLGHPMIMGRRTFESLVKQFGGPLPGRHHIVLSSTETFDEYENVEPCRSYFDAMERIRDEDLVFVAGGGAVYEQFLAVADRLELTLVEGEYEGDAFFPEYDHMVGRIFKLVRDEPRQGFRFVTYERILPIWTDEADASTEDAGC